MRSAAPAAPAAVAALAAVFAIGSCALPGGDAERPAIVAGATPTEAPGVHNLIEVAPGVFSGSVPEGEAGFDTLAALGVRTVISVDGARPDVERARARAMRYVHVPVEYAGIDRDERMDLARAVRDLPRPIFVHCHHGKHRGPAAAAVALGLNGELTPDEALAFLETAGTSPSYPGLWQCAREAGPAAPGELDAWDAALPEIAEVGGFVAGMAVLDRAYDRLKMVQASGWAVPPDHPDLVPAALAGQIADIFRVLSEQTEEPEFTAAQMVADLRAAGEQAGAVERALKAGDHAAAEGPWKLVVASCRDCHEAHRNSR